MSLLENIELITTRVEKSAILIDKLRSDKRDLQQRLTLALAHNHELQGFVDTYKVDEEKNAELIEASLDTLDDIDSFDDIDLFALSADEFEQADTFAMSAIAMDDTGLDDVLLEEELK